MRIGETLGQYRIVDVVGQGGMAEVYVGEHEVVQHRVAIKVVHSRHVGDRRMAQRLIYEARAVAAIRHPGIVEFYDFGCADDGRPYIVMELLQGETLAARLERGPLPVDQAVAFARQMASALGAAHGHGIIHRDLKPANIFLVADPDVPFGERAKILDFGIAKHITGRREEITATGMMIGTPAHMSPEQCRGDKEIDGRADVYALGVLLFHMVTGKLPFDGLETSEIVSRHLYEQCPAATAVNPAVPETVSRVIAWCMTKDRQRRCPAMDELTSALTQVAAAERRNRRASADAARRRAPSSSSPVARPSSPAVRASSPAMRPSSPAVRASSP
ncbi:MAG: serine/threonine protein kinase, partial [Myxococcales bacterium]|nr:serine/threonine protein kinase [Myxococcales bacterium]